MDEINDILSIAVKDFSTFLFAIGETRLNGMIRICYISEVSSGLLESSRKGNISIQFSFAKATTELYYVTIFACHNGIFYRYAFLLSYVKKKGGGQL